jgi:hypothetical protein
MKKYTIQSALSEKQQYDRILGFAGIGLMGLLLVVIIIYIA